MTKEQEDNLLDDPRPAKSYSKPIIPNKGAIDAWLKHQEQQKKDDKVSYEMSPVAWHLEQVTGINATKITHSDCCYFVMKVGAEYLRRKLRGVGETKAALLCKLAKEWTNQ